LDNHLFLYQIHQLDYLEQRHRRPITFLGDFKLHKPQVYNLEEETLHHLVDSLEIQSHPSLNRQRLKYHQVLYLEEEFLLVLKVLQLKI